jgi:LacI family transcriptional regulator
MTGACSGPLNEEQPVRKKSTIYEVATRSGVSTATVSRVMQSGKGFSEATRARVLAAAADLGWVPSGTARGLAERRVGIVGLIFPDLSKDTDLESESPLFVDQVIRGAERAATLAGDALLIASTHSKAGRELALRVAGKVDALIVSAPALPQNDLNSIARSVPVVVISARSARGMYDVVNVDNRVGTAALTRHLVDVHGCRDIAFVAGPRHSPDSTERFAGFRVALRAAGIATAAQPDARGDFTERGGAAAMREILAERRTPPHAVVFGNDQMAVGALAVLREQGLRAPADVAVTGFDDIASARYTSPALTTVRQPMRQLGEEAVRAAFARIQRPSGEPKTLTLPTQVVVRRSCGCRRTGPRGAPTAAPTPASTPESERSRRKR